MPKVNKQGSKNSANKRWPYNREDKEFYRLFKQVGLAGALEQKLTILP